MKHIFHGTIFMTSCHVQVQTYEANWLKMLMASFTKSFVNLQCIMDLVVNSCLHNIFYISYNHASFQKKEKVNNDSCKHLIWFFIINNHIQSRILWWTWYQISFQFFGLINLYNQNFIEAKSVWVLAEFSQEVKIRKSIM